MSDVPLELPVNAVYSYHYFQKADVGALAASGVRIVADSGAFSASGTGIAVDKEAFYAWAQRWQASLLWTASLDVIGDHEASWANWMTAPKSLRLVPTVHYGQGTDTLDRYAETGQTLIGLGGMVPRKSESARLMRWTLSMMIHAKRYWPEVRFHGWGVTHPDLLNNLPWWSVDSSGFSSAYRYGRLRLWDDRAKANRTVALDGKGAARDRDLLAEYGASWEEVLASTRENRRTLVRLGLASVQRQQAWLQARHNVTPPPHLEGCGITGPLIHGVDAAVTHWQHIRPLEAA